VTNEALNVLCLSPDRDAAKALVSALDALPGFSVTAREADYQEGLRVLPATGPDLAIVIFDRDPARGLGVIEGVHRNAPGARVLAVGREENPQTIIKAVRAGADDFLLLPLSTSELIKVCIKVAEIRRHSKLQREGQGEIWVVHAPKAGVGATTVAAHLALALREADRDVALLDLDLHAGELALVLNVTPEYTLRDITENDNRIDSLFLQGTMTRHRSGLELLAAPVLLPGESEPPLTESITGTVLDLLCSMHAVTVVDTPFLPSPAVQAALARANRVLLLTDLSLTAVRACLGALDAWRADRIDVERVVELVINKQAKIPAEIPPAEAAKILKHPIRAILPRDDAALAAVNNGIPLRDVRNGGALAEAIEQLTTPAGQDGSGDSKRRGLLGLFGGRAKRA